MSTWMDGKCVYPVHVLGGNTLYNYPGTRTSKIQYSGMYDINSGERSSNVVTDATWSMYEYRRARTTSDTKTCHDYLTRMR